MKSLVFWYFCKLITFSVSCNACGRKLQWLCCLLYQKGSQLLIQIYWYFQTGHFSYSKFLGIIAHSQIKNWLSVYVIHSIANVDFWIVMTESDHDINHCVDCSAQSEENLINAGKWRSSLSSSPSDGSSTNNSEQRLTIGPSMSFYPDFISIYPDFIQILSSRNQDKIKIRSR